MRQAERGHKITVLTCKRLNLEPRQEILEGRYLIVRLKKTWMPWEVFGIENPLLPALFQAIGRLDFDLIHAHSHLFWTTVFACATAHVRKKPIVVTVHGVRAKRGFLLNLAQYAYLYTLGSWIFKRSTRIICLTEADATEIKRFGADESRIRVVPNAVDTELFRPGEDERTYVLWVGRFVPEKGLRFLIDAAKIVLKRHEEVKFLLVGDGPLKSQIARSVVKKGLRRKFSFVGKMSQSDVARIMRDASMFVLPSLKEGFPKTLLEAMACGKPVIVSDIPGVREVVENGSSGILVPPGDSEALAQAIVKLLNEKDLRLKLGERVRRLVLEKYNWPKVAEQIESVFVEAITENSRTQIPV
jgi:glycosyltransferase involved in cell wall biosynthesis